MVNKPMPTKLYRCQKQEIKVPNIGDFKDVEVIEVLVSEGQTLQKNDPLITIESDKSSVEIPSNFEGKIKSLKIKIGDKVSEGDLILTLEGKSQTDKSDEEKPNIEKEFKKNKVIKSEIEETSIKQVKSSSQEVHNLQAQKLGNLQGNLE